VGGFLTQTRLGTLGQVEVEKVCSNGIQNLEPIMNNLLKTGCKIYMKLKGGGGTSAGGQEKGKLENTKGKTICRVFPTNFGVRIKKTSKGSFH